MSNHAPSLKQFTASLGIKALRWQGTVGYRRVDADRILKVELTGKRRASITVAGTYVGLELTLIHKIYGPIDSTLISFDEVGMTRADQRSDWPGGFEVKSHCGWDWGSALPSSTAPIAEAVEVWAEMFS